MDKFSTFLNIANKQTNLCLGFVALLTAGGEQIFSTAVFKCPCNDLNFLYGMVSLLVPALALLLLGLILSKRAWKLCTGLCHRRRKLCYWRRLLATGITLCQISSTALVAPSSWIAVALLGGNYFECAVTGTNVSFYKPCGDTSSVKDCETELPRFPCGGDSTVPKADRDEILLTLRAQSQILGWLLIASIMLSNLMVTCLGQCTSPISYLQLQFWKAYVQEESSMMESYSVEHAKQLAERNLKNFFNKTPLEKIITPSNNDWENISSLYKFSSKVQHYSNLHKHVENCQDDMMRVGSVSSVESASNTPAVLHFVDDSKMVL